MDTKTTALTQKPAPAPTTDIDIELIAESLLLDGLSTKQPSSA